MRWSFKTAQNGSERPIFLLKNFLFYTADAGNAVDGLCALAVLIGHIRYDDLADVMFLCVGLEIVIAAGRMDDHRNAVIVLAKVHHDMARLEA